MYMQKRLMVKYKNTKSLVPSDGNFFYQKDLVKWPQEGFLGELEQDKNN